jgi:hypothetical protein
MQERHHLVKRIWRKQLRWPLLYFSLETLSNVVAGSGCTAGLKGVRVIKAD